MNELNKNQNKKGKILKMILIAGLCVGIVSVSSFALLANAADKTNPNGGLLQTVQSALKKVATQGTTEGTATKSSADKNMQKGMRGMMDMGRDLFKSDDIATFLGITQDELKTKLDAANGNIIKVLADAGKLDAYKAKVLADLKTKLDQAVTDGKMTQAQADQVYASAQTMADSITSSSDINVNFNFGDGKEKGFGMKFSFGGDIDIAALLGITQDELNTKIQAANGNIFKVLEDAGKLDAYKAQVLANYKTKLDAAVAAGKMTQADADAKYAEEQTEVNSLSSSTPMAFGRGDKMCGEKGGMGMDMDMGAGVRMNDVDVAALLGITQDELKTQIQAANGNILKVIEDAGKLDAYKAQILANCKTKLDAAVAAGKMTQADADAAYAKMQTSVNNMSSANAPGMNFKGGERGNWRGGQKRADGQTTATATTADNKGV